MNLREIDRLVAEKVMGWVLAGSGSRYWADPNAPRADGYCGNVGRCFDGFDGDVPEFQPTEDIAAAWEVMEKLKMYEPELCWSDETHSWWFVCNKLPHRVQSETSAPLVICLAALKARGVEVPG